MAIALRGGRLFDGTGAPAWPASTVILDGDRIRAVFPDPNAPAPPGAAEVDCRGKTLLPGLMNLHGHLGWDGYHDLEQQSRFDGPLVYFKVARSLRSCLEAGVTTFRDLGVHQSALVAKRALKSGLIIGPRLFATGAALMCTGGHTWWVGRQADGPADVRKAVREQIKAGADWIKVMASGHQEVEYSFPELQAAAEEAHMHGVRITAHATFNPSVRMCLEAGFDCIEHGGDFSDEIVQEFVRRGVWVVPTFSPTWMQARFGLEWGMRPEDVELRRRRLENPARFLGVARMAKAGVQMAFGTDSGSPVVPHNQIVEEMKALLHFGVYANTAEVLRAATLRSAQCLGLERDLGTLEPDKLADVVVVDGDPLADLDHLTRVEQVYLAGRQVVEAGAVIKGG